MTRAAASESLSEGLTAACLLAAERHGTPTIVMETAAVDAAAAEVEAAFPADWLRHFSLKANDLPDIVRHLHRRGWGANVVSVGEWQQAMAAGVPAEATTFEGIGKSPWQLGVIAERSKAGHRLRWVSLESAEEAVSLTGELQARRVREPLDVLVRYNPASVPETIPGLAVGAATSKFGMTRGEILSLAEELLTAQRSLRLRGVHVHVGSQLDGPGAWAEAGADAVRLCQELATLAPGCDTVDFGGGFPLQQGQPAAADHSPPEAFAEALAATMAHRGLELPARCGIEPGRIPVGAAGAIVTTVLHVRSRPGRPQQVVIDAGMTELIRPALYGARHPIVALAAAAGGAEPVLTWVEGPVCESTDTFGEFMLPPLRRGDLLAIGHAGAYAGSFTSRYNGRPHPVEVLAGPDGSLNVADRVNLRPVEASA